MEMNLPGEEISDRTMLAASALVHFSVGEWDPSGRPSRGESHSPPDSSSFLLHWLLCVGPAAAGTVHLAKQG